MAVGVLITMPKTTKKQYEKVNEKIFGRHPIQPNDAPDGLIVHSAGPLPDGWYAYDIWKTKEDFRRFGKERIAPAVREVTGLEFGDQQLQFFEISNLIPGERVARAAATSARR